MLLGFGMSAQPLYRLFTWRQINIPKGFKCPLVPLIPVLAIGFNLYMMVNLNIDAWLRLFAWLGLGLIVYASYGRRHSKLN